MLVGGGGVLVGGGGGLGSAYGLELVQGLGISIRGYAWGKEGLGFREQRIPVEGLRLKVSEAFSLMEDSTNCFSFLSLWVEGFGFKA